MHKTFDTIILGAGIYGMYIAKRLLEKGQSVAIIEYDVAPFQRASFINQARVHNGYHYPRSFSTAIKSAKYFERFNEEFSFAINKEFKKIYAISSVYSMTSAKQFEYFCESSDIPCREIKLPHIFSPGMIESAYETLEYSFDAQKIQEYLLTEIQKYKEGSFFFSHKLNHVENTGDEYRLSFHDERNIISGKHVINTTYASTNQVLKKFGFPPFSLKYEIAELILCDAVGLDGYGITVMDGPFFSAMPFGLTGKYSLTSVGHTPAKTSYDPYPTFDCQEKNKKCTNESLENCDLCPVRPKSRFLEMQQISKKYFTEDVKLIYDRSHFAIKPILQISEVDDSRPTIIREYSSKPRFTSVLSGKINTMYDLESLLES